MQLAERSDYGEKSTEGSIVSGDTAGETGRGTAVSPRIVIRRIL